MCFIHKFTQLLARTKSRINLYKVLNAISMIGLQVFTLFPNGSYPKGRSAHVFKILQFAFDAGNRSTLEPFTAFHPFDFIVAFMYQRIIFIKHRTVKFMTITEAVRQKEIKNMISPCQRTWMYRSTWLKICIKKFGWCSYFNGCHSISLSSSSISGSSEFIVPLAIIN